MFNFLKKEKKEWKEGWSGCEEKYARRDPEYVIPDKRDDKIYKKLKKVVKEYTHLRDNCIYGYVIFSCRTADTSEFKATSEILARLAEQGCTFSAYRTGYNTYLIDQINHPRRGFRLD